MFNQFFTKFNKHSPYFAKNFTKIADKSLTISNNKSSKMDRSMTMSDWLVCSSAMGGIVGGAIGLHIGARESADSGDASKIFIDGMEGGYIGCILGVLCPLTIPVYLISNAYKKYYEE